MLKNTTFINERDTIASPSAIICIYQGSILSSAISIVNLPFVEALYPGTIRRPYCICQLSVMYSQPPCLMHL